MAKQKQLSPKYQVWVDARKRHKLSHVHIQMARELEMNPKKFGKLDNHKQESWKAPLPIFIEDLYFKRFGKDRPENVRSIEQMVKDKKKKQLERKQRKLRTKEKSQQDSGAEIPLRRTPAPLLTEKNASIFLSQVGFPLNSALAEFIKTSWRYTV